MDYHPSSQCSSSIPQTPAAPDRSLIWGAWGSSASEPGVHWLTLLALASLTSNLLSTTQRISAHGHMHLPQQPGRSAGLWLYWSDAPAQPWRSWILALTCRLASWPGLVQPSHHWNFRQLHSFNYLRPVQLPWSMQMTQGAKADA